MLSRGLKPSLVLAVFVTCKDGGGGGQPKGLNPKLLRLMSGLLGRVALTAARRQFDCRGIKMRLTTELDELAVAELYVIRTRMPPDAVVNYSG